MNRPHAGPAGSRRHAFRAAAIRSGGAAGCTVTNPTPDTPAWRTVIDFLDKHLKGTGGVVS
jgi:hypothetical protein